MKEGYEADLSNLIIPNAVTISSLPEPLIGDVHVWALRHCKQVDIPEGAEKIGNYWFYNCEVESIVVSASVREIGVEAFCNCKKLKSVLFPAES